MSGISNFFILNKKNCSVTELNASVCLWAYASSIKYSENERFHNFAQYSLNSYNIIHDCVLYIYMSLANSFTVFIDFCNFKKCLYQITVNY